MISYTQWHYQLVHQGNYMELSTYNKSDINEIKHLFSKVFSDSESQTEGSIIESLVFDLIKTTDSQDIYGFIATENDQIIGSIFFTRLTFESTVNAFILIEALRAKSYFLLYFK